MLFVHLLKSSCSLPVVGVRTMHPVTSTLTLALIFKDICCKGILEDLGLIFKNQQYWSNKEKVGKELKINLPLLKVKKKKKLSYVSTSVMEYHDQGNIKKINWDYYFRGLESIKVKQGHGSRDTWEFTHWPISRRQIEDSIKMLQTWNFKICLSSYTFSNNGSS